MSITNQIIFEVTKWRNPNGCEFTWSKRSVDERKTVSFEKVAIAELAYLAIIPFAVVETALSGVAACFGCFLCDLSMAKRSVNALFGLGWASLNLILNLVQNDMYAWPQMAWKALTTQNESPYLNPVSLEDGILRLHAK